MSILSRTSHTLLIALFVVFGAFFVFPPQVASTNGSPTLVSTNVIPTPGSIENGTTNSGPTSWFLDPRNIPKGSSGSSVLNQRLWRIVDNVLGPIYIVLSLIAVVVISFSGYRIIASQGDPAKMKEAREQLVQAFLGVIVVFLAATLVIIIIAISQGIISFLPGGSSSVTPPGI